MRCQQAEIIVQLEVELNKGHGARVTGAQVVKSAGAGMG